MRLPQLLRALRPAVGTRAGSAPSGVVSPGPRPIVVGLDGSPNGLRALEWAVIRAWAGHTSLHLVHALQAPSWLEPQGLGVWWPTDPGEVAHRLLDAATELAHELVPELHVTASLRVSTRPSPCSTRAATPSSSCSAVAVLDLERTRLRPGVTSRVARGARGRVVVVGPDHEVLV